MTTANLSQSTAFYDSVKIGLDEAAPKPVQNMAYESPRERCRLFKTGGSRDPVEGTNGEFEEHVFLVESICGELSHRGDAKPWLGI